jgi:hypothetical protein
LVVESAGSIIRRDPAGHVLREMIGDAENVKTIPISRFKSEEEVERFLERDPRATIRWNTAPRVAFEFAFWPLSQRARARAHECIRAGQRPTFELIEGKDLSRAWDEVAESDPPPET